MRALALSFAIVASGCHPEDVDGMERQPRAAPYATSKLFADGRAMRTPPPGAIPRERDLGERQPVVTPALLALGRTRYEVVCAPCHGNAGDGETVLAAKMALLAPPSLHEPRFRGLDPAAIYHIITEGYGLMPRYATHLRPLERWAVVAYVRALQLSQHFPIAEAPAPLRRTLEETP